MLSCFKERPPPQQVNPEVVRAIVREVIGEMRKNTRSPHDSPQMRQVSTTSIKQNSKPKL